MKRLMLLPLIALLNGCPGGTDRLDLGKWQAISIDAERICYTVNKQDVLSSYYLEEYGKGKSIILLSSGRNSNLNILYPSTCFNAAIKQGYQYEASYKLNGVKHYYRFTIDNNGEPQGVR